MNALRCISATRVYYDINSLVFLIIKQDMLHIDPIQWYLNLNSMLTRCIFEEAYIVFLNVIPNFRRKFFDIIMIIIANCLDKIFFLVNGAKIPAS